MKEENGNSTSTRKKNKWQVLHTIAWIAIVIATPFAVLYS